MASRTFLSCLFAALVTLTFHASAGEAAAGSPSGAPYVPSPHSIVTRMLELAGVNEDDFVVDLGSGDGRIVLTAAKLFDARGLGVEIREDLVRQSRRAARRQGVEGLARFEKQDLFETDISDATLVTVYLLPDTLTRLRGKLLRELAPGTRVISHDYPLDNWTPERFVQLDHPEKVEVTGTSQTNLYLYRVPADVRGPWEATVPPQLSREIIGLEFAQTVTVGAGRARFEGRESALENVEVSGRRLTFRLPEQNATFIAQVQGGRLEGHVRLDGKRLPWRAQRP